MMKGRGVSVTQWSLRDMPHLLCPNVLEICHQLSGEDMGMNDRHFELRIKDNVRKGKSTRANQISEVECIDRYQPKV